MSLTLVFLFSFKLLLFALCIAGGLCGPGLTRSSSEEEKGGPFALVRVGLFRARLDGRGEEEDKGREGDGGVGRRGGGGGNGEER